MGHVRTSRDILGCEGTFETWDFGDCSSWDKSGYSEALHYIFVYLGQLGKSVAVLDIYAPHYGFVPLIMRKLGGGMKES